MPLPGLLRERYRGLLPRGEFVGLIVLDAASFGCHMFVFICLRPTGIIYIIACRKPLGGSNPLQALIQSAKVCLGLSVLRPQFLSYENRALIDIYFDRGGGLQPRLNHAPHGRACVCERDANGFESTTKCERPFLVSSFARPLSVPCACSLVAQQISVREGTDARLGESRRATLSYPEQPWCTTERLEALVVALPLEAWSDLPCESTWAVKCAGCCERQREMNRA